MNQAIEVKNVSKQYRAFTLDKISFNIPKGSIVGLIGENGAGKTTTIKAILNMIAVNGQIRVLGQEYKDHEREIKQQLGVVLDNSFLSDYLTAKGVNSIMKDIYSKWNEKQFFDYIQSFKLPTDKLIKTFSSGMKMKLKIATAMAHDPKVLLLDEPTSGLDPISRSDILEIFRNYMAEDETRSILLSSHITSDLSTIADYVIFIHEGRILFQMPTVDLLENYGIVKCSEQDFLKFKKEDYIRYRKEKYQYEILVSDKHRIAKHYHVSVIDKPTIDDIMLFYIKGVA